jgi:hypothetical protein
MVEFEKLKTGFREVQFIGTARHFPKKSLTGVIIAKSAQEV